MIENEVNGMKYIGRKIFWTTRRLPPLKGKVRKRVVKKESDWRNYWSSSDQLKADIVDFGIENFTRTILSLHHGKGELAYYELYHQMQHNVLHALDENGKSLFYNDNILAKYFFTNTAPPHLKKLRESVKKKLPVA